MQNPNKPHCDLEIEKEGSGILGVKGTNRGNHREMKMTKRAECNRLTSKKIHAEGGDRQKLKT